MKRQICKLLAILLAITMVAALVPGMALAAGDGTATGTMDGAAFINSAKDGKITLTGDVTLTSAANVSGKLEIDLAGHKLTNTIQGSSTGGINCVIILNNKAAVLTVTDSDTQKRGVIVGGDRKDSEITSYNTVDVSGAILVKTAGATLTVDGAKIKGGDAYATKYADHAIYVSATNNTVETKINVINGAEIIGGTVHKKEAGNDSPKSTATQESGAGIKINPWPATTNRSVKLVVDGATVTGGGDDTGTSAGVGINVQHAEVEIRNKSVISGGKCDKATRSNDGEAIDAYTNTKLVINGSTVTGGTGGNAISATSATDETEIIDSAITGGNGSDPGSAVYYSNGKLTVKGSKLYGGLNNSSDNSLGCGIEINSTTKYYITVEESEIYGSEYATGYRYTNGDKFYGNAIYLISGNHNNGDSSIALKDTKLFARNDYYGLIGDEKTTSNPLNVTLSGTITVLHESGREGVEAGITGKTLANVNITIPEGESLVIDGAIGTASAKATIGAEKTEIPTGTTLYIAPNGVENGVTYEGVTYTGTGTLAKSGEGTITATGTVTAAFSEIGKTVGTIDGKTYKAATEDASIVITDGTVTAGDGCVLGAESDGVIPVKKLAKSDVTVQTTAGGSAAVDKENPVTEDETVTVTVTANEGYEINSVTATSGEETVEVKDTGAEGKYTFTMPAGDVTVNVTFVMKQEDEEAPPTIVDEPTVETEIPEDVAQQLPADYNPGEGFDIDSSEAVQEMENAGIGAVDTVPEANLEEAVEKLKDGDEETEVYIHVITTIDTKVTGYTASGDEKTLTLEIAPHYHIIATTAEDKEDITDDNAVELKSAEITVTKPVNITVPIPADLAGEGKPVYIKHEKDGGKIYWYSGTVTDGTVTFNNPHGFSTFTVTNTPPKAAAKIEGTSYETLQDALDEVKDGDVIEVLVDDPLTATAPAKNVTFTVKGASGIEPDVTIRDNGNYHVSKGADGKYTVTYVAPPVPTTPTPSKPDEPDEPDTDPVDVFVDVPAGAWYRDALNYVLENTTGVINGTDATHFSPNEKLTRAAFAKILWAIEGSKPTTAENPFTDVKSGDWFYDAVIWANAQGIMLGKGENLCAPNDNITREEMALMIQRWKAGKAAGEVAFPDAKDVHDWAADAVAWAAEQSYIKGKDDGRFAPLDSLTRAEMITVVARTLGFEG